MKGLGLAIIAAKKKPAMGPAEESDEEEAGESDAEEQKEDAVRALAEAFGVDPGAVDIDAAKAALDLYLGS